ncbi:MAG: RNA polymerase sigma factor [Chloroflexota bacterium]|nr:RNA polymerase sigma factor [Chloroflexota bacterium]
MQDIERARGHEDDTVEEKEAAVVARLRGLDPSAWTELYDGHHLQIWRYAYGRTSSRDAADDVAAQVFAEALASIHRYRYKGRPILAWLYAIARHLASKHVRRTRKDAPEGEVEPSGGSLEERLDSLVLADALKLLTTEQREVIILRFYSGYSTREIAAAVGKREAAVYSLEVRAIGALRRQLAQNGQNFPAEADKNSPRPGIDKVR